MNSPCPPGQSGVAGHLRIFIVGPNDPLICRYDQPGRRIVKIWELGKRDITCPVAVSCGAVIRKLSASRSPDRDRPGSVPAYVPFYVCENEILGWTAVSGKCGFKIFPAPSAVQVEECFKLTVAGLEGGPFQSIPLAAVLKQDRPVAGFGHLENYRVGIGFCQTLAYLYLFPPDLRCFPSCRGLIFVLGVERLDVQVLDVRADVGCAPREAFVMAQDNARNAGECHAGNPQGRRAEMGHVPDARSRRREMRIVGKNRLAVDGPLA